MAPEPLRVLMIAGPNGAGKPTFARHFLPREAGCPVFVNADLIAAGLSPFSPDAAARQAARVMLTEMRRHFVERRSFALETTLAGLGYRRCIREWRATGYRVTLIFLSLASVEEAIARVAERVRQGGHDLPESVIRRRFTAGLRNFDAFYTRAVDDWALYDNSGSRPRLLRWGERHD